MADLSEQQKAEFLEIFKGFDKNNDGKISRQELRPLLSMVGNKVKSEELGNYVKQYDVDKSGEIDFDEFLVLASNLIKNRVEP
ncbi:hypothetical protein B0O80DRAFT_403863 [Mortierella sp. GBAus27b]|nr:hypothetical protein BGX31_008830 [Mortierella sp. GBA43]KAI8351289.1 hypothetical protein B0O80DRAFT_403863 [Mortierella sp. GBAus27b]